MPTLTTLSRYKDDNGNIIDFDGEVTENIRINFEGTNGHLIVESPIDIGRLNARFIGDGGRIHVGPSEGVPPFRATILAGQDCNVDIGRNVSMTAICIISTAEGSSVTIGDDCMLASNNEIRADDSHPIFDVNSGMRVNPSESIVIGSHVWLAKNAIVMGGVTIGNGTVVGHGAVVTHDLPNNVVAAGMPARVVRRDVAWERPHLAVAKPYYKLDASTVEKSEFWAPTAPTER